jgi:hypothetical protein
MAHLTKLTISNATREISINPIIGRRAKLLEKLDEQFAMAKALLAGEPYSATRKVWTTDEQGNKQRVDREKRVNVWYWNDIAGKFWFELRYGAQKLELAKGKHAIEVGARDRLVTVIETVIEAVRGGELDAALTSAAAVKAGKQKAKG